jgi:hypothetical protein
VPDLWGRLQSGDVSNSFFSLFFLQIFSKQGDVLNLDKAYGVDQSALMIAKRESGPKTLKAFLDMPKWANLWAYIDEPDGLMAGQIF